MHVPNTKFDIVIDLMGIVASIFVVFGTVFLIWKTSPQWLNNFKQKEFANVPAGVLGVQDNSIKLKVQPVKLVSNLIENKGFTFEDNAYTYTITFTQLYKGDYSWDILKIKSDKKYIISVSSNPTKLPLSFKLSKEGRNLIRYPFKMYEFVAPHSEQTIKLNIHAKSNVAYPFTIMVKVVEK